MERCEVRFFAPEKTRDWARVIGHFILAVLLLACDRGPSKQAPTETVPASSALVTASVKTQSTASPTALQDACHEGLARTVATTDKAFGMHVFVNPDAGRTGAIATAFEAIAAQVEKRAPERLDFLLTNTADEETMELYADDEDMLKSISEMQITSHFVKRTIGVTVDHHGVERLILLNGVDDLWGLEYRLGVTMRFLRALEEERSIRVGVVDGKRQLAIDESNLVPPSGKAVGGETYRGPSIEILLSQAMPDYPLEKVRLEEPIEPAIKVLIVTQPGEDYTDAELKRIDRFVMQGGSLIVFASAVNIPPFTGSAEATLDTHRIDVLLNGYGVTMSRDLVVDPKLPLMGGALLYLNTQPESELNSRTELNRRSPIFLGLKKATFPLSSTLEVKPGAQTEAKFTVIAHTSRKASSIRESPVDLGVDKLQSGARAGVRPIGITIEGRLKSPFGNGETTQARVLVISSSQFWANPLARVTNPPANAKNGAITSGSKKLRKHARRYAKEHLPDTLVALRSMLDWATVDDGLFACGQLPTLPRVTTRLTSDDFATRGCDKEQIIRMVDQDGMRLDQAIEVCSSPQP